MLHCLVSSLVSPEGWTDSAESAAAINDEKIVVVVVWAVFY